MSSTACLACASFWTSRARSTTFMLGPCYGSKNGELPIATPGLALAISPSCIPMSPSRASARTVSENMRTPILSLGATSSSIACMIEGTPAITITLPIQKPGAPDTLLRMRSAPLGMRVRRRRASFISAPVVFTHSCRMASARGSVSIGTPNAFRHAIGGDVTVGRPDPAGGEDRPERIECIDDRSLLVANHPHFLEIDADRRQIFRDIADVLVLGAAGQDLATEITRSAAVTASLEAGASAVVMITAGERTKRWTDARRETRELVVRPYTAIVGYAASSHRRGKLEKGFCATYVIHRN